MTINIFYISLAALYLISSSLFGLAALPVSTQDAILIISLAVLIFYIKELDRESIHEDRYFHYFLAYGFLGSIVMAYLNFNQPVIYSIRAARLLLAYSILLFSLNIMLKDFQVKRVYPFLILIVLIIAFINIYVYTTGDTSILMDPDTSVLKRLGEIRIRIGMFTSIIFVFFFYHKLKEEKWFIVPLLALLFVLVVVAKTRSVVFPVLIIMLIPLLRAHKAEVIKVWIVLILIAVVSYIVSGYEKSVISPVIKLLELLFEESQTTGKTNVSIRAVELAYYWNFLDVKSIIFGYGIDNSQFRELYIPNFYLSDIGLFKIFYYHGIVGSALYILMLWRLYSVSKRSNDALHFTGRAIVYFQILSPNSVFVYSPEYMFLVFVVYILVKNSNKEIPVVNNTEDKNAKNLYSNS